MFGPGAQARAQLRTPSARGASRVARNDRAHPREDARNGASYVRTPEELPEDKRRQLVPRLIVLPTPLLSSCRGPSEVSREGGRNRSNGGRLWLRGGGWTLPLWFASKRPSDREGRRRRKPDAGQQSGQQRWAVVLADRCANRSAVLLKGAILGIPSSGGPSH
jgi:hypothetical protein